MNTVASLGLSVWAVGLAYEDLRWRRLPNSLLLGGVLLGCTHYVAYGAMPFGSSFAEAALAASLGLLMFLPIYAAGWMGAGDIKFLAVIGCLGGFNVLLTTLLLGSVLAGFLALFLLLLGGRSLMSNPFLESRLRGRIPFGASLAFIVLVLVNGWLDVNVLSLSGLRFGHVS